MSNHVYGPVPSRRLGRSLGIDVTPPLPNKTCNFISLGKPYHHVCPRCQNPFLIEGKKNGETILKCPRATCRYWQGDLKEKPQADSAVRKISKNAGNPKPRRRVVKRRVVRKKR